MIDAPAATLAREFRDSFKANPASRIGVFVISVSPSIMAFSETLPSNARLSLGRPSWLSFRSSA